MAYNYPNSIGHGGKNWTHCRWLADAFYAKLTIEKNNPLLLSLPPSSPRRPLAPGGRRPGRHPWGDRPPGGERPPQGCRRGGAPTACRCRLAGRASAKDHVNYLRLGSVALVPARCRGTRVWRSRDRSRRGLDAREERRVGVWIFKKKVAVSLRIE